MSKNVKSIIFFLFHFNKGGGAEEVVTNLANEMAKQGIRVRVLCVKNGTMFPELDQTVEQIHCDSNYRKAFLCLMKSFKTFDVLFTTQRFASVFAYIAKRISFSKIKFVLREAGIDFQKTLDKYTGYKKILLTKLLICAYNRCDLLIVNSNRTHLDLITPNVVDENKKNVVLINNPIDHDKINRLSEKKNNINIVFAKYNILSIGRLVPNKQMDKVIKAFYRLNRKLQNQSQLIIIGRGDEELALKNLVKELKIDDKVVFIEFTNNPYAILKKCQLLVLASKREGFGMVVLEALVLGIPVVVNSNDSGPKDIVMGGKYGYLFNNDDLDDLSKKIEKGLLNSKFDSKELIKGSKKYGKQKITSEYIKNIFDWTL